jgi:hypothetical protein
MQVTTERRNLYNKGAKTAEAREVAIGALGEEKRECHFSIRQG